jgi:hypothetical protein
VIVKIVNGRRESQFLLAKYPSVEVGRISSESFKVLIPQEDTLFPDSSLRIEELKNHLSIEHTHISISIRI